MMYCDYDIYLGKGGTMAEHEWEVWGARASRKIDRLSHGRAERHANTLEAELADACVRIAVIMAAVDDVKTRAMGVTSATTDGYSESYADPLLATQAAERACYEALADALGDDCYGLLYAGVM